MKKIYIIFFSIIFCAFNVNITQSHEIEGFKTHLIVKGDTLWKIVPKEHWDIIKRINKIDEKHLIIGKTILIPNDLSKAIKFCPVPKNTTEKEKLPKILYIYLDIQYFGAYEQGNLLFWGPISSGKKLYETPMGNNKVLWKAKKYFSKKYDDAPMPYSVNYSSNGYFVHQQAMPGKPASHGCVRLLMSDAKKIFYWIKIGNPINIKTLDN